MSPIRRVVVWTAAIAAWSCSSTTVRDQSPTDNVAGVLVTPSVVTVSLGRQQPLQAVVQGADGQAMPGAAVVWSVKDAKIASVSSSGVVTALAVGATQVAASANGKSGIAAITVENSPVASVVVRPLQIDAAVGSRVPMTAVAYDAGGNLLSGRVRTWTSSNAQVATVDSTGMVTALAAGTATITATVEDKSDAGTIIVTQAPVASLAVAPPVLSMSVGQTTQLIATPRDATGNVLLGRAIQWSSSNTGVASISVDGKLTAIAPGTTTITAVSEGKTATSAVTISNVAVASVTVQPQGSTIPQSASLQLSATVRDVTDAVAADRIVTWTTTNAAIVTVTSEGLVTGVAPGTATVTATSEGKSGTTTVTVSPNVTTVPVGAVTVAPAAATVVVGKTTTLAATVKDVNGTIVTNRVVAWTSGSPGVATVTSDGVVSAVAVGTATITATSEGKSGSATVTVSAVPPTAVASVTVQPSAASVMATQTTTLSAITKDASGNVLTGRVVTWASSNAAVATVSSTGVVSGAAPGTATITATSEGQNGTASVTVTAVPVGTVAVQPATSTVIVGQTATLAATVKDANGTVVTDRVVTWTSSATGVATVTQAGVVTAVAPGVATITATSEGKSGSATVTVSAPQPTPVATVAVQPPTVTLTATKTTALSAITKDANDNTLTGRTVTWVSSNTTVATVSSTGVVTGVARGTATITATSEGKNGTASVTVTPVPVGSVTIAPATASVGTLQSTTLTATVKDANGTVVTDRAVTWTTSNALVATVSQSGVVTGVVPGMVTITATSEGISGTSTVTINLLLGAASGSAPIPSR